MKRMLLTIKLSLATSLFGLLLVASPVSALAGAQTVASTSSSKNAVCQGAGLSGAECSGSGSSSLNTIIKGILQLLSVLVGVAAVIMIIVSGFRYITSGGDAAKVGAAKGALIYALVGLVVVALAQVLVRFVITKAA